jgi:hypothetical protein
MATTIDHLSAHHHVRVLQPFTDARGNTVPADATGVITDISLDLKTLDVFIDWVRDDSGVQRLSFKLNASTGPRNNHMREYFELGPYVEPPRPPGPAPPAPPPPWGGGSAHPLPQPGGSLQLGERTVACSCDAIYHRQVYPAGRLTVAACLRCGTATVSRMSGDDGRFTGDAWTAYTAVPTPQHLVDWLSRFPRVQADYAGAPWRWPMSAALVRYPTLFYPADLRVDTADELRAAETELAALQAPHPRVERLRAACGDITPQPTDLRYDFDGYGQVAHALRLQPLGDLDTLILLARLGRPACELAADLMLRRPDGYDVMMLLLRSDDGDAFSSGIAMLRDARPLFTGPDDERLGPALLQLMDELPVGKLDGSPDRIESWSRFEHLLVAIADLEIRTSDMVAGLGALMKKVARRDATIVDAIRIVINELNGVDNRPEQYR